MGKVSRSSSLSLEESQLANEAKKRTLAILNDALKKKDALLLDNPEEFGDQEKPSHFPLISTDLVKQMIPQLEKATFKKGEDPKKVAFARSTKKNIFIFLCPKFWRQHEVFELDSRPETLIKTALLLLECNEDKNKRSQHDNPSASSACPIERAFSTIMNHSATYVNGSYSCCGERSEDTVCVKSLMSVSLRALRVARPVLSRAEQMLEYVITKRSIRKRRHTARLVGNMLERVKKMKQSLLM